MDSPAPIPDADPLIAVLKDIRERNNVLWLGVVRLAMKHAPEEARKLFKEIERNDEAITEAIRNFYRASE